MHERNWVQQSVCSQERVVCRVEGLVVGIWSSVSLPLLLLLVLWLLLLLTPVLFITSNSLKVLLI